MHKHEHNPHMHSYTLTHNTHMHTHTLTEGKIFVNFSEWIQVNVFMKSKFYIKIYAIYHTIL